MSDPDPCLLDIDVQDFEYLRHGPDPLFVRVYAPQGPGPFPLLAELHGGAWCRGDRLDEDRLNRELASRGIVMAALDFRQPPQGVYPASLQDINLGIRWLKAHAGRWHSTEARVGVMGLSSGAHQAILGAMRPQDPRYAALPLPEGPHLDASVPFAVLCWPVIDPIARYRYGKALQSSGQPYPPAIDRVLPDHDRYWPDEAAMEEGNPARALQRGEAMRRPEVLLLQGTADAMHPMPHLERFIEDYRRSGGCLSLELYPGEDAGFVNKRPDSPSTLRAIADIARFVHRAAGLRR